MSLKSLSIFRYWFIYTFYKDIKKNIQHIFVNIYCLRYSGGAVGVQEGYSGDTVGVQEGYSGVQEKSIKQHNTGILFSYLLKHNIHNEQNNKRTWYDMLYMRYLL